MTTVPAGLAAYPDATPTANLAWAPSATTWTNYVKDVNPAFFAKVDVAVVGQSDAQKEPAKTMNAWWTTNQQKIKDAGFAGDALKVSSWAMIVDIEFAKTAPKFYSAVAHGNSIAGNKKADGWKTGTGCTASAIAAGHFCLPENANTNALFGVCTKWEAMCLAATCANDADTNCKLADGSTNSATANLVDKCAVFANFTKPAVGDVGDEVGVLIWNKTATKKIPGIRIGRRVLTVTNCVQDATAAAAGADDTLVT